MRVGWKKNGFRPWLFIGRGGLDSSGESTVALFRSDGSPAGTEKVKDLQPAVGVRVTFFDGLTDAALFRVSDQLWSSDGTADGTHRLSEYFTGPVSYRGEVFYLHIDDETLEAGLWRTDGTVLGTHLVATLDSSGYNRAISVVNDRILMINGDQIWVSDGTAEGTTLIKDVNVEGDSSGRIVGHAGNSLMLNLDNGVHGRELWRTDGTPGGTQQLTDIFPGEASSDPRFVGELDDQLLFSVEDGVHGREMWRTDGTPQGTRLVKDIHVGPSTSGVRGLGEAGDSLLLVAYDGINGTELWKTDGSEENTVLVKDIKPGSGSGFHASLSVRTIVLNGLLYFVTTDSGVRQMWRTDGSEAGTQRLTDPTVADVWGPNSQLTAAGGAVFFAGKLGGEDRIFRTDGTPEGTVVVATGPASLAAFGNTIFDLSERSFPALVREVHVPPGGGLVEFTARDGWLSLKRNGTEFFSDQLIDLGTLHVVGSTSRETFSFDFSSDAPIPVGDVRIVGGNGDAQGSDSIVLNGGSVDETRYLFRDATSGAVDVDSRVIAFTGISEIREEADERGFLLPTGDDGVTVEGDGLETKFQFGETEVVFANPAGGLNIDGGEGANTLVLREISSSFEATVNFARFEGALTGGSVQLEGGWKYVQQVERMGRYFLVAKNGEQVARVPSPDSVWHNPLTEHSPWHNPLDPLDVDGDGAIRARDIVLVVNRLNAREFDPALSGPLPPSGQPILVDVDGNRMLTLFDVLHWINAFNQRAGSATAEGEVSQTRSPSTLGNWWSEVLDNEEADAISEEHARDPATGEEKQILARIAPIRQPPAASGLRTREMLFHEFAEAEPHEWRELLVGTSAADSLETNVSRFAAPGQEFP